MPLVCLFTLLWMLPVTGSPSGDRELAFVPLTPLSHEELFAKRMRFMNGEPMISVGLMEQQRVVSLWADGPARLMFDDAELPKTVYAPPETRFSFRPLSATRAVLRYWAVVEVFRDGESQAANEAALRWRARGHASKVFEVGTIVGLQGNVLDTRERHVAIGDAGSRESIEALIRDLSRKEGRAPFVHEELVHRPSGLIGIYDERGALLHRAQNSVYVGTVEGGQVHVDGVEHNRGYANHGRQDRQFWAHLYVGIDREGLLSVINSVGAEKLLAGLVPAEIFATAPLEALKAQAVTARGEIFSKLANRHFGEPYHLCTEQHCQVYAGAGQERSETNRAVEETRGLLAVRPRPLGDKEPLRLVDSVYSSSCGGFSEANDVVWGNARSESLEPRLDGPATDPALAPFVGGLTESSIRSWLDAYPPTECARSSFQRADKFRWKRTFGAAKLNALLRGKDLGTLQDVQILGRGPGGRVTGIRLVGSRHSFDVLRELPVRRLFGNLNSGMFIIDLERATHGGIISITFKGGGWGHGVGMCQMGAIGRAERNQEFRQILSHYYNGAAVERIY